MSANTFDWLKQQELGAWRRRLYQLRRELSQQQVNRAGAQQAPQEVAMPQSEQTSKPIRPIKSVQ